MTTPWSASAGRNAEAFCQWLSRKTGKRVSLPTECSGNTPAVPGRPRRIRGATARTTGNGWCNLADRSFDKKQPGWPNAKWDDGYAFSSPVGRFRANGFGLHDMCGNAWSCARTGTGRRTTRPRRPWTPVGLRPERPGPFGASRRGPRLLLLRGQGTFHLRDPTERGVRVPRGGGTGSACPLRFPAVPPPLEREGIGARLRQVRRAWRTWNSPSSSAATRR